MKKNMKKSMKSGVTTQWTEHDTGNRANNLSRVLPQLGERIHTVKGNAYRVVEN